MSLVGLNIKDGHRDLYDGEGSLEYLEPYRTQIPRIEVQITPTGHQRQGSFIICPTDKYGSLDNTAQNVFTCYFQNAATEQRNILHFKYDQLYLHEGLIKLIKICFTEWLPMCSTLLDCIENQHPMKGSSTNYSCYSETGSEFEVCSQNSGRSVAGDDSEEETPLDAQIRRMEDLMNQEFNGMCIANSNPLSVNEKVDKGLDDDEPNSEHTPTPDEFDGCSSYDILDDIESNDL